MCVLIYVILNLVFMLLYIKGYKMLDGYYLFVLLLFLKVVSYIWFFKY